MCFLREPPKQAVTLWFPLGFPYKNPFVGFSKKETPKRCPSKNSRFPCGFLFLFPPQTKGSLNKKEKTKKPRTRFPCPPRPFPRLAGGNLVHGELPGAILVQLRKHVLRRSDNVSDPGGWTRVVGGFLRRPKTGYGRVSQAVGFCCKRNKQK